MAVTSQQIVRHAEPLGLLAELGRVQLGGGNQQRHAALQQPCLGGAGGDLGAVAAEVGLAGGAVAKRDGVVNAGHQYCAAHAVAAQPQRGVGEVLGDVRRAGGMPAQDDALRVAAIFCGVALRPQQGGGDVLLRGGPGVLGGQAVIDVDAEQPAACRPQHDVVVKRAACAALVATHKAAAVHKQQDGARCGGGRCGGENVQALQRVAAEGLVAGNGGVIVGLARVQRGIQRLGGERIDDCAELAQRGGDGGGDLGGKDGGLHGDGSQ